MVVESDRVRALRVQYRSGLADKSKQLADLVDEELPELYPMLNKIYDSSENQQHQIPSDDASLRETPLPAYLHQLAGSAGMYGYQEIATRSRRLLEYFTPPHSDLSPANPLSYTELKAELDFLVAEMQATADNI